MPDPIQPSQIDLACAEAGRIGERLLKEGERGAVLLGAARLDLALEKSLKSIMRPHPDGNDNLFQPDRPLGSFSAKISLAYRLNLIDHNVEHALQMIRKIRNDFAHSFESESLNNQSHRNRLARPLADAKKLAAWEGLDEILAKQSANRDFTNYVLLVVILVGFIEVANSLQIEHQPKLTLKFY